MSAALLEVEDLHTHFRLKGKVVRAGVRRPAQLARPGVHRRRPHRRDPDPAQGDDQARGARQGERAAPAGRHFRPGPAARQLSPRAERRDAAAGHDRHRAVLRPRPVDRGQSDHGPGRHDPDPDPGPGEAAPRSTRDGRAMDHARSRRRRQALRPGRDHVRRRSHGTRRRLRRAQAPAASLYTPAHRCAAEARKADGGHGVRCLYPEE